MMSWLLENGLLEKVGDVLATNNQYVNEKKHGRCFKKLSGRLDNVQDNGPHVALKGKRGREEESMEDVGEGAKKQKKGEKILASGGSDVLFVEAGLSEQLRSSQ